MSKTGSVTKYLTNIYKCVIFCVTLFCSTIRDMSIFLIFWNIGYHLKDTFNFGIFLQLTPKKTTKVEIFFKFCLKDFLICIVSKAKKRYNLLTIFFPHKTRNLKIIYKFIRIFSNLCFYFMFVYNLNKFQKKKVYARNAHTFTSNIICILIQN